jgi:hypothetical protein
MLSVDHGRWHVTLGGMAGKAPPIDEEGFLKWAHELADPSIYEALRIAQPLIPFVDMALQRIICAILSRCNAGLLAS